MIQPSPVTLEDLGPLAAGVPPREPVPESNPAKAQSPVGVRVPIPVCEPRLAGNELAYVQRCVETGWISSQGAYVEAFEERFAELCGAKYGIATSNGTTALHLALATLGLGPGDEVIIPTFTMIATANVVRATGARPVFVDSEPHTWNIDPEGIEAKITPRTRAIVPVHTYGHPADMDRIGAIAERHGLAVIEDAAEAHGAEYHGRRAGSLGLAASFSFYANKILTCGEGGMVTTSDPEFARIARILRDHAFSEERHFWHRYPGFNFRMTNMQAAVGLAQCERFDELVARRIENARRYTEGLRGVPGITTPPQAPGIMSVYWMYGLLVDSDRYGRTRDELRELLARRGIETRTFFIPMHLQPIFYTGGAERYPVAERLGAGGLYLPSAGTLTERDIGYVVAIVRDARL